MRRWGGHHLPCYSTGRDPHSCAQQTSEFACMCLFVLLCVGEYLPAEFLLASVYGSRCGTQHTLLSSDQNTLLFSSHFFFFVWLTMELFLAFNDARFFFLLFSLPPFKKKEDQKPNPAAFTYAFLMYYFPNKIIQDMIWETNNQLSEGETSSGVATGFHWARRMNRQGLGAGLLCRNKANNTR